MKKLKYILSISLICISTSSCGIVNFFGCLNEVLCHDVRQLAYSKDGYTKIKCKEEPNWGCLSKVDYKSPFNDVKEAADKGDVNAMLLLSPSGVGDNKHNIPFADSIKYLEKAADAGYANAQQEISLYYINGVPYHEEFKKDYKKGLYWAKRANCSYHTMFASYLGDLYSKNQQAKNITQEEFDLVETNLPLAYAHYSFRMCKLYCSGPNQNVERVKKLMTKDQIKLGKKIIDVMNETQANGQCFYEIPEVGNKRIKVPLYEDTKSLPKAQTLAF